MKYEWRKREKEIYGLINKPTLIDIPKFKYITVTDSGNPNEKNFSLNVEVLYALSYAIRMMPKNAYTPKGYFEYTVYPLEGLWSLTEAGQKKDKLDKNDLVYKIMIKQPDFVTNDIFDRAMALVKVKNPSLHIERAVFEEINEGKCIQMLHTGSFDDEYKTFEIMNNYIKDNGLTKLTFDHKEIYLSDPRKTAPEKLKTILRYYVK